MVDSGCNKKQLRASVDSIVMCLNYIILQTQDLTEQDFGTNYVSFKTKKECFLSESQIYQPHPMVFATQQEKLFLLEILCIWNQTEVWELFGKYME